MHFLHIRIHKTNTHPSQICHYGFLADRFGQQWLSTVISWSTSTGQPPCHVLRITEVHACQPNMTNDRWWPCPTPTHNVIVCCHRWVSAALMDVSCFHPLLSGQCHIDQSFQYCMLYLYTELYSVTGLIYIFCGVCYQRWMYMLFWPLMDVRCFCPLLWGNVKEINHFDFYG